ncbi:MAG: molybdopterin biosynthesis protein [Chloroflexi bacterium]|nr:molybdopterin biosynthesis protein [Chloroflexota bacterium]
MTQRGHRRRYYLSDIPLDEAIRRFHAALEEVGALGPMPAEVVPLDEARGRVTAVPVWAKVSSPHYDSAAMDGVAVRARDTVGATETSPVRLRVGEQARWVDTGDPMPPGTDAVIMVEVVHKVDESTIEIQSPVAPYQHVRPLGEDIVATELVLPENWLLRPVDLAACAAAGLTELAVRRRPRVAVIPTGTELVPAGSPLKRGDIIEFNTLMLAGMIQEWGGDATRWPSIPDDYARLKAAINEAIGDYDIVVVNAGSSAGSEDYTAGLVEELGRLVVHGTAIRPGHPIVLGVVDGKPFVGIPGYPVSAALTCELFVQPLIERKLGIIIPERSKIAATMTRKVLSPIGEDEFLRVRLGRVGEKMVATPVQRGAGVITSLSRADGLVRIPRFSEGVDAGQSVTVELLRPIEQVENTIVAIGSHDLTLDLLASHLRRANPRLSLSSSNVGSLGGLLALSRGEAHLAGSHLLDDSTGEYNISFIQRYVKGREVVLMNLVRRVQGLIVPKGNPKSIASLHDLARVAARFVNRQRGSGTRVLLDYKLREMGLTPSQIAGYEREEYTHLAVAAAVAGGNADAGLGILSAARAMGLDFVPLLTEQYDLVIPTEHYEGELLQPLLSLIRSEGFRREVDALGGYDTSSMGEIVAALGG